MSDQQNTNKIYQKHSRSRSRSEDKYHQKQNVPEQKIVIEEQKSQDQKISTLIYEFIQSKMDVLNKQYQINRKDQKYLDLYDLFCKMPKTVDLHSHYSSCVFYDVILHDIETNFKNGAHYQDLMWGYEYYKTNKSLVLGFGAELKQQSQSYQGLKPFATSKSQFIQALSQEVDNITTQKQQDYSRNSNQHQKQQQYKKYSHQQQYCKQTQQQQQQKFCQDSEKQQNISIFGQFYLLIGCVFFNLIKSELYFKRYLDLIIANMDKQNIYYQEIRLGGLNNSIFIQIFEYILEKKYQNRIKIIYQLSRNKPLSVKKKVLTEFFELSLKKYTIDNNILIGIDFVGEEGKHDSETLYNDECINKKMKELNLIYLLHGGEYIETSSDLQKNKDQFVQNVENIFQYVFKQKDFPQNRPKRVGHGIRYLQFASSNKIQANQYADVYFEICPISYINFLRAEFDVKYIQEFCDNIVIGSDDQNKLFADLTDNYCYLYTKGFKDLQFLEKIQLNSIKSSNLSMEQKKNLTEKFQVEFSKWKVIYQKYQEENAKKQ